MRPAAVLAASTVTIACIGYVDVVTGPELGMSLFYLVPVSLTAWHARRVRGLIAAFLAGASWFLSDLAARESVNLFVSTWNGVTRLGIYVGAAVLLSTLHADRDKLRSLLVLAESSARTDALTGLANSRAFYDRLRADLPRIDRSKVAITIAYLDLDNFKRINDTHGHAGGDEVLRDVAEALRTCVRAADVAARLGGDEFAIALWDTRLEDAEVVLARLRRAVATIGERFPGSGLGASVGAAALDPALGIDAALQAADTAMYLAKAQRKAAR